MPFDRAWREIAAIDERLDRGEIDEKQWYAEMAALVVPAYLAADTPWGQSGKSGDAARWMHARRPIVAAIDRSGAFLDVGCASGYLMESVAAWAAEDGVAIEPHGLDIAPELAELARRRLPHWADRVWTGNALSWRPPRRFDFVRTGLEYVPARRRRELVEHLLGDVCEPTGRLIIGVFNEERRTRATEELVESWGFAISGRVEAPRREAGTVYRVLWIDAG